MIVAMLGADLSEVLDSGSLRVCGYLVAAGIAVTRYVHERRIPSPRPAASWPRYWLLTTVLLVFLGVSRATTFGGWISELGRSQARSEGWYDDGRRTVQSIAVLAVVAVWLFGVVIAIWRVPPRRRRYLPNVVAVSALVSFAAIRVVSLHHIDTLLYRRHLGDVRFVAVIELTLLVATIATIAIVPRLDVEPTHSSVAQNTAG